MNKSLSNFEIMSLLGDKTKIITYPEVRKYTNVEELLYPWGNIVILYMTGDSYGHWTTLFKHSDGSIEFMDSYGKLPDQPLEVEFINERDGQEHFYLTRLLSICKRKVVYNHYKLQSKDRRVSTCGRWVVLRLLNKEKTLEEFYDELVQEKKKNESFDQLVCRLIKV
jgi:hypothetical protein